MNQGILAPDLLSSELIIVTRMQQLGFGRFEFVQIHHRELVLDPEPVTVQYVKFASDQSQASPTKPGEFQLKRQVIELLEYVRATEAGEIRRLEIRHGLPFSMEIEHRHHSNGGDRD